MNLELILSIFATLVLLYVMVRSADLIESSFVFIASKIQISTFFIGFIVLGAAANLPELSIIFASRETAIPLSIGNLLGSSLISFTLILGTAVIRFKGMHFLGRFTIIENVMCILAIQTMVFTMLDGHVYPSEGIVLIAMYLLILLHLYRKFSVRDEHDEVSRIDVSSEKVFILLIKAIVGIVLLLISSSLLVDVIVKVGTSLGVSQIFLGVVVITLGTNLPEITILFRATDYDQRKLAFGNFLGSAFVIIALMGILSIVATNGAYVTNFVELLPILAVMTVAVIFFGVFSFTGKKLTKYEGLFLVLLYVLLLIYQVLLVIS